MPSKYPEGPTKHQFLQAATSKGFFGGWNRGCIVVWFVCVFLRVIQAKLLRFHGVFVSDLIAKHQFSPPDACGVTSDPGSPSTLAPKPFQGRWLYVWLLKLAPRWHAVQNIEQTQAPQAGPHTMFLSALKNRSAWIQHMMCDIYRSVNGIQIILNCTKPITENKTEHGIR